MLKGSKTGSNQHYGHSDTRRRSGYPTGATERPSSPFQLGISLHMHPTCEGSTAVMPCSVGLAYLTALFVLGPLSHQLFLARFSPHGDESIELPRR
ncbi:hypothetical protein LZ32DRAFT_333713 [Colletotrichum eremochloae]|nr:hypothetical protein LZ32DRAFT_333713 [Colletotrichum eremochloae]